MSYQYVSQCEVSGQTRTYLDSYLSFYALPVTKPSMLPRLDLSPLPMLKYSTGLERTNVLISADTDFGTLLAESHTQLPWIILISEHPIAERFT